MNDSVGPYNYHLAKCGEGVFERMEYNQVHTYIHNGQLKVMTRTKLYGEIKETEMLGVKIKTLCLNQNLLMEVKKL